MKNKKLIRSFAILLFLSFTMIKELSFSQNIKALPAPINTLKFTELSPSISADGKILVFESNRQGEWKLFESRKNGNTWSLPVAISKISTNNFEKAPFGAPCLSYDGNTIFFSGNGKDSGGHEDIYFSVRDSTGWSAPKNIGGAINTIDEESFPSLSADGQSLYFARAKYPTSTKAEQRCYKIMVAKRKADGTWEKAVELPSNINAGCEQAPRIMLDGSTLIFSSIRKGGKGGFDLYKTQLQNDGTWSNPVALDNLNTPKSEQMIASPACGDFSYFAKEGDIYVAPLISDPLVLFELSVKDSLTKKAINTPVSIFETSASQQLLTILSSSESNGKYLAYLSARGKFLIEINEKDYTLTKQIIDLSSKKDCEKVVVDILLSKKPAPKNTLTQEVVVTAPAPIKNPTNNTTSNNTATKDSKVMTLNFTAFNKVTNEQMSAEFIVTSENTGEVYKGKTQQANDFFSIPLTRKDILKVQVKAEGYADGNSTIEIKDLNKGHHDYAIPMVVDRYPLTIKVIDAETKDAIKDATIKIVDLDASEVKNATARPQSNDYVANLKISSRYEFILNAEDYIELKEKVEKAPAGNSINFMLYKNSIPITFEVIDNETEKPVKAFIDIKLEKLRRNILFKNETKARVRVTTQEVFTVETSALKYVTKHSTFNMPDFDATKKYEYTIHIEKAMTLLTIKPKNRITKEAVVPDKIIVTNLSNINNKAKIDHLSNGDALLSLNPEDKYHLEIRANGYDVFEQDLSKINQAELECLLIPIQKQKGIYLTAIDSTSGKPLEATFLLSTTKTKKNYTVSTNSRLPESFLALEDKDEYEVEITAKDYHVKKVTFKYTPTKNPMLYTMMLVKIPTQVTKKESPSNVTPPPTTAPKVQKSIDGSNVQNLSTIEKGQSVVLDKVYFEQSSFILQKESYAELDKLVGLLQKDTQIKIEIGGHTDNIGDSRLNLALSENRARVIYNYLVSKGIAESRLFFKGYGSTKPVAPNDTEENKKKNRRVELTIQ